MYIIYTVNRFMRLEELKKMRSSQLLRETSDLDGIRTRGF